MTNLYFSRARAQLNAGDFAGAERTMRESAEKYEPRTERAELEQFVSLLRNADELISRLGGVMPSAELRSVAEDLKRVAKNLPGSAGVIAYAERKIREADELAKLEADRRFVWLWFDAQDELRTGDVRKAGLLTALISAGRPDGDADPMVRDLMNGGMFDKN